MFKLKNLLLIITGLSLLFTSCVKEEVNVVEDGIEASFHTYINEAGTRASGTNWDADDEIGIYALNHGQTLSTSAIYDGKANIQYKNSTAGSAADFSPVGNPIMFPGDGAELDFVAYYPYSATAVSADYKLAVNISNQSPLSAIDLLYATASKQSKADPSVNLAFSHRMTQVVFILTAAEGIDLNGVTVTLENVLTEGTMNLVDGVVTAGTATGNVTPVYDATANTATAILLPGQQMSDVVVQIELTDGTSYTWSPAAYVLTPNTTNSYTLNFTKGEVEAIVDGSTIGDWGDGNDSPSEDLDPNAPAPEAPKAEVTASELDATGGTTTLQITAPAGTEWTASTDADWLTLGTPTAVTRSSQNFTGSADIEVTAEENTTTEERTGTITVTIGTETLTATVTQAAAEDTDPTPEFSVDVDVLSFIADGETKNIALTSNIAWTATSSEEWLTVDPANGTEGATIAVTVTENTETTDRSATVTLTPDASSDLTAIVISVTQEGAEETTPDVGDGTESNPYSVAQVITTQDKTTAWVHGYIIGYVVNGPKLGTDIKSAVDTNIMLAESMDRIES